MAPKRKFAVDTKVTQEKKKMKTSHEPKVETHATTSNASSVTENSVNIINDITPIAKLNVMTRNWKIEARVIAKFPVKYWKNKTNEGKLFNITVMDKSGEIRIVGFNEMVETFYEKVEEDSIYFISNGQIRLANKLYNTTKHECEIFVNDKTELEKCENPMNSVPVMKYDLKKIKEVKNCEENSIIDTIAMCTFVENLEEFTAKSTGRHLKKKEITLQDETGSIKFTVWNERAEEEFEKGTILLITNAKISEFMKEKNLTTTANTNIKRNPKVNESKLLKQIFE